MLRNTLCVILLTMLASAALPSVAALPVENGARLRYAVQIDMQRAYVSGVCILRREGNMVRGGIVNEFGVTAMTFEHDLRRDRIKLTHVLSMLDKWYIRRTLRRDLRQVMHCLDAGIMTYENTKRGIVYRFSEMPQMQTE